MRHIFLQLWHGMSFKRELFGFLAEYIIIAERINKFQLLFQFRLIFRYLVKYKISLGLFRRMERYVHIDGCCLSSIFFHIGNS